MAKKTEITTGQVIEACEALGLNPNDVMEVHMYAERIFVTELVRDENGHTVYDPAAGNLKKTSRTIRVKWGRS